MRIKNTKTKRTKAASKDQKKQVPANSPLPLLGIFGCMDGCVEIVKL
jgi:hypothetical protein